MNVNNNYYFPPNPNSSQLNKDSQVYQPNYPGYHNPIMNGMQPGNNGDWPSNSQRKLDRNSTVFEPGNKNNPNSQGHFSNNPNSANQKRANPSHSNVQPNNVARQQPNQPPNDPQWNNKSVPNNRPQNFQVETVISQEVVNSVFDPRTGIKQNSETERVVQCILMMKDQTKKYDCFKELNGQRDNVPMLAPLLWYTPCTVAILLQEIIAIYPYLTPPTLTQAHSERICNALALFQCIALHHSTKPLFIQANLHLYLYPLINTVIKQRPFEHLRVTSLGVIGALVKGEDSEAIKQLINTELIVLCLRIMKKGHDLSRTVATFIVHKILVDDNGLVYVCQTGDRLYAVAQILKDIIEDIAKDPKSDKDGQRLLRHIMRCFLRLSENQNAVTSLATYIPDCIRNPNNNVIKDVQVKCWYMELMKNLKLV